MAEAAVEAYLKGGPEPPPVAFRPLLTDELVARYRSEHERREDMSLAELVERAGCHDERFLDHRFPSQPLGVLTPEQALAFVRDWLLSVDVVPEYVPLQPAAIEHADGLHHVPAEHPLRGPDAVAECARRHEGSCSLCGSSIAKVGIQVRLDVDGVVISREYELVGSERTSASTSEAHGDGRRSTE